MSPRHITESSLGSPQVHLKGAFKVTRAAWPHMVRTPVERFATAIRGGESFLGHVFLGWLYCICSIHMYTSIYCVYIYIDR